MLVIVKCDDSKSGWYGAQGKVVEVGSWTDTKFPERDKVGYHVIKCELNNKLVEDLSKSTWKHVKAVYVADEMGIPKEYCIVEDVSNEEAEKYLRPMQEF